MSLVEQTEPFFVLDHGRGEIFKLEGEMLTFFNSRSDAQRLGEEAMMKLVTEKAMELPDEHPELVALVLENAITGSLREVHPYMNISLNESWIRYMEWEKGVSEPIQYTPDPHRLFLDAYYHIS